MSQQGNPYQQPGPGQPYGGPPYGGQPPAAPYGGQYQAPPPAGYGVPQQQAYAAQQRYGQQPGYGPQPGYGAMAPRPEVAPNGEPLAEQFVRLGARLIDGLIVGGVATVIFVPVIIGIVVATTDASTAGPSVLLLLLAELGLFLFILVGQYVYEVELAKRTGQTVGKRLLKIRVIPLAPRQPIARSHLAKRWLVTGPGGMIPGLGLINAVWCLWDKPYRQCLHDKFADTVVVKVPG